MELAIVNRIVGVMYDTGRTDIETCEKQFSRVRDAVERAEFTICDLKPLAELLGCEPEMGAIKELAEKSVWVNKRYATEAVVHEKTHVTQRWAARLVAEALNWRRTEFDTLDELLEELQATARVKYDELGEALRDRERVIRAAREKLCMLAETLGSTPLLDEAIELLGPRSSRQDLVELDSSKLEAMLRKPSGFAKGGYVKELPEYDVAAVLHPTHTLLHAGELYRDVTILLHTEQLVAWRTADGQEYSAPAHQVQLDPDEDGLAAAILSRIAGVEIAPEHMAELRAQMAGGVTHG